MKLEWTPVSVNGEPRPYWLRAGDYEVNACGGEAVLFFLGQALARPYNEDEMPTPFWRDLQSACDAAQAHADGVLRLDLYTAVAEH